ncbi:hypothetical protein ES708_24061 [subsurface metagenome]
MLKSSIRLTIKFIPNCKTKLEPKATKKNPIKETILKVFAFFDFPLDSEKSRLNLSATIIRILTPKIVMKNDEITLKIKVRKL